MRFTLNRARTEIRSRGFTIVELLIVIIVIVILAAIVIVAYRGIQDHARASAISSGFTAINKALRLKALADGRTTWWGDASTYLTGSANPHIDDIITATDLKTTSSMHRPSMDSRRRPLTGGTTMTVTPTIHHPPAPHPWRRLG